MTKPTTTSRPSLWQQLSDRFRTYLKLEKNFSDNTVESYTRDLRQFRAFVDSEYGIEPTEIEPVHIEAYMASVFDRGAAKSSQARLLSGVKNFYNFLLIENIIEELPTEFTDSPKAGRTLPDILSVEEIDAMVATIDLSTQQGHRNKAIIETLYSCGLRVSELTELRISDLFFDDGIIRVTGKGDKQRLVPVSQTARHNIELYLAQRVHLKIDPRHENTVFLNRLGRALSRVMVFNIIKECGEKAGTQKNISPHTLRHSFATHLLEGGASIRQVQEMLGHSSIMTTEIYTHLNTSGLRLSLETHHPLSNRLKK